MENEIKSLLENNTWTEISCFDGNVKPSLISTRWTFSVKFDGDTEIAKARRGFQDKNNYELSDTYFPVINATVFRWFLSFAHRFKLHVFTLDVVTAFL